MARRSAALRTALGMTLSDLATAAGLSPGMLSKVETGQTSPSLATLSALAGALNMPLASFFTKFDQKSDATFVKSGQGLTIERRGSSKGHQYQLLGHGLQERGRGRAVPDHPRRNRRRLPDLPA